MSDKKTVTKPYAIHNVKKQKISAKKAGSLPSELYKKQKSPTAIKKMPSVAVIDIIARDTNGILLGRFYSADSKNNNSTKVIDKKHTENTPLIALSFAVSTSSRSQSAAGIGTRVLAKIFPSEEEGEEKGFIPYQGRIIRVLSKQAATILGIIRRGQQGFYRIEPTDRKQNELLITAKDLNGAKEGDLVLVKPLFQQTQHHRGSTAQFGRVKQRIGNEENEIAISAIALYAHNIRVDFPAEVLAEAEKAEQHKITGKREDWLQIPFITIDPESAKDHDDAVFAKADTDKRNKNGHIIMVAIADVAAYVRPRSAMDKEARLRGNSVYFPDRVVPMLPEVISNNLCSLREGAIRPALAAQIILNAKGCILRHSFHRIWMRSRAKLSYEQAQAAIDGYGDDKTSPLLESVLRPLWFAYTALQTARNKRQPLELNLPERKLFLDENGRIEEIRTQPRLDAHRLIEDFMIAANIAAAETLKAKNNRLLFRIHDSPSVAKQESLREFLQSIGIKLGSGADITPEKLNTVLTKAAGKDYEELVNQVVLRAQAQAEYSSDNIGHFGLKLHNYAHFTSPIRRYADLVLHRCLIKALHLGTDGITREEEAQLDLIATEISDAERRAMLAERETNDRLIAYYLSENIGAQFSGRINGVTRAGLFITLNKTGADGLVPISSLKGKDGSSDYYHFDEAHFALIGERSRKGFQLGDNVEVRLLEVQKAAGSLRFELLSLPKKLPFSAKSFHKAGSGRKSYSHRPHKSRRH